MPPNVGYRSDHRKWWPAHLHAAHEREELGNYFPDDPRLGDWEGIWICHEYERALRYGDIVHEVDLTGAELLHDDGDGGYFYIRPAR